jgi:signal transduction histidine kinase/tetratricopeptide (TPR) repeat protein
MKPYFLYLLFTIICFNVLSQKTTKIDSLQQLLSKNIHDTIKVEILFKIAEEVYLSSPDEAKKYCFKAEKLSNEIQFENGLAVAYGWLAYLYEQEGNIKEALAYNYKSLDIFERIGNKKDYAVVLNNLGAMYKDMGKIDDAIEMYNRSLKIKKELKKNDDISTILNNIGLLYFGQGKIVEALDYYHQSLKNAEFHNNKSEIITSLINIGSVYKEQEQFQDALNYFNKSLEIALKINDKNSLISNYSNIANLHLAKKEYQLSLENYYKSLSIAEEIHSKKGKAYALENLSDIYVERKNEEKALDYLQHALELFKETEDHWGMSKTHCKLSQIYLKQNKIKDAKYHAEIAYRLAKEMSFMVDMKNAAFVLTKIYETEQNWKEAFKMQNLFIKYRDSVQNKETLKASLRDRIRYDYEKKEAILKSQQSQKEAEYKLETARQNWIIFAITGGILALLLITFAIYRGQKKLKIAFHQLKLANEEILVQKEEIYTQSEELKNTNQKLVELDQFKRNMIGMIVHDLKNPINALLNLQNTQEKEYLKQVQNYSKLMQGLVLDILDVQRFEEAEMVFDKNKISINKLIESATEQIVFLTKQKNIQIKTSIENNFTIIVDIELITRVVVNLLTNAIKYSSFNQVIEITSYQKDSNGFVSIRDYGQGISNDKLNKIFDKFVQIDAKHSQSMRSTGLGLTFCKMTIEAHEGQIGVSSDIGKGSLFWFSLPIVEVLEHTLKITTTEKNLISNKKILLSENDKIILKPFISELQKIEVYFTTDLEKILEKIPTENNQNLANWKAEIEKAIFNMNQSLYRQLLDDGIL